MKEIQHVKRSANGADHNEMNHSSSQDFSQIIQAQHELLSEQGRQIHELKVKLDNNLKLTDGLQTQIEEMQDAFQEWREREKSVSGSSSTTITNNDDLSVTTGLQEQIDRLTSAYNGIQDQLYEIDKSWKNNLILYGLPYSDSMDEDPLILEERVRDIFHKKLHISRDMAIHRITRLWYGPDCRGYKPIQIAFSQYKDKEEVLRKARLLKGGSIYLSEDFSRKVRQHRHELIKFMKEVKSRDPARRMVLRYDKLYIGTEIYFYNDLNNRIERQHNGMELGHPSRKNSALLENMVLNEAQASMSEQHQAWLRRPKSGTSSRSETPIQATSSMNDLTRPTRSAGNRSKRTVRTLSKAASIDSLDYSNSDFELNRPTNGRFYDYPESPSKNHTYDTPTGSPMKAKKVVAFADVEEPSVSHEVERYVPINSQQLVSLSQQSQPNGDGLPPIHQMMQVERPLALRNHIQMNVSSNLPAITNGTSSLNKIQLSLPPPPPSHDDHEGEGGEKYNNNPRALTHSSEGTMVQTNHLVPINGRIPSNGKRSNNGGTLVQTEGGMIKVALYGEFPVTQMK